MATVHKVNFNNLCHQQYKSQERIKFLLSFLFINKTLQFSHLKTRTAKNGNILAFVICVEPIKYLLCNFCDYTFNVLQINSF